jgi:flavodoxin
MKILVLYYSKGGNTEKLGQRVGELIKKLSL